MTSTFTKYFKALGFLACVIVANISQLHAQPIGLSDGLISNDVSNLLNAEQRAATQSQSDLAFGNSDDHNNLEPLPFGANLFSSGYESERSDGLSPDYLVASGDKIALWIWGAINTETTLTVDNQGNVFIPSVGPIQVVGTPASQINSLISREIRKVYTNGVSIYVNLLTTTPVSIYVAGNVVRPGQYAGLPTDSILYFLHRSGGIDFDRGSFRKISVLRNGEELYQLDLYDFMLSGNIERPQLKDGDTLFIHPIGKTISVFSGAKNALKFEFSNSMTGQDIINIARPHTNISHVGVTGVRQGTPFSQYVDMQAFAALDLADGDQILFSNDLRPHIYDISVEGSYLGQSGYAVSKGTTLHQLLAEISIDPILADVSNIRLMRKSVAEQQKEQIEQSLQRLERSVFTAPVSSTGDAAIRSYETQMVLQFVERARRIEPLGSVIVSSNGIVADIQLEQGDVIVIPTRSELVAVSGEVLMPQTVVYNEAASLEDYVTWAGGFTERSDYERIGILRANGKLDFIDDSQFSLAASELALQGGDQILVFPRVDTKMMQSVKDITQIVYQIAVAANAVTN